MSGEWPVLTLQDVCQKITDGAHSSPSDCADGYPMASVKDLHSWGLDLTTARTIAKSDYDLLVANGCKPIKGDVLIAKDGATCLDTVCVHKHDQDVVLLSSVAILRPSSKLDSGFLRYYLDAPSTRAMLKSGYVSGSAIPRVVLKDFRRAPIPLPPLPEQRRIAKILGDLDDKIELNRTMNETLEQMARALFKSWFVDFDPVRAKMEGRTPTGMDAATAALFPDRLVDSELGPIPEGWEVKALGEVIAVLEVGGRPKGGVSGISEGVPSIGAESIVGIGRFDYSKTKYVPVEYFESMRKGHVENHDVLLYKDGGRPGEYEPHVSMFGGGFPFDQCCINEHVYRIRVSDTLSQEYLYFWLNTEAALDEMRVKGTGVAIPGLNSSAVRTLSILVPNNQVVDTFNMVAANVVGKIFRNSNQSRTLSTLRDTLLPKLVGGEVRV